MLQLYYVLDDADNPEAERWLRRAAQDGHTEAMLYLAGSLPLAAARGEGGAFDEAWSWLRHAVAAWDPRLVGMLDDPPRNTHRWDGVHTPATKAFVAAAELCEAVGRDAQTERLWRALDEYGYWNALLRLAKLLARNDRVAEARELMRARAETGDVVAALQFAEFLTEQVDLEQAEPWLRRAVAAGNSDAVSKLVDLLQRTGRREEADRIRRFGIAPGGEAAEPW